MHRALIPFQNADIISAQWYKIEEAERWIPVFKPQPPPNIKCRGYVEPNQFWPRARRSARTYVPGGASGDESEGEEESDAPEGGPEVDADAPGGDADAAVDDELLEFQDPLLSAYEVDLAPPDPDADEVSGAVGVDDDPPLPPPPLPPPDEDPAARRAPPREGPRRTPLRHVDIPSVILERGTIVY